jgi:hypothetical protein
MSLDTKQLGRKEWGILIAGAVAFVSLFLPWYGASVAGYTAASVNAWSTGYGWMAAALLVAASVYLFIRLQGDVKLPARSVSVILVLSAVGLLLVLIRLGSLPTGSGSVAGVATYQYGGRIGIVIALIAGLVQVVCAGLLFRSSRRNPGIEPNAPTAPTNP